MKAMIEVAKAGTEGEGAGLFVMKRPVGLAHELQEVREATTGRVVAVLPTVWAVAASSSKMGLAEPKAESGIGVHRATVQPVAEVAFYRKYTEAMLRRYLRLSMEAGRVPSLLGRELFRGNVTSYKVRSFEDVVIFCHDVEKCLGQLQPMERQLVKRIALQEYTQGEAAAMLGLSLRSCIQRYRQTLDRLTGIFLAARLMEPLKDCQEEGRSRF